MAKTPEHTRAERDVLARITPKRNPAIVSRTIAQAQRALRSQRAHVTLGGSAAKGTHLAADHDIDVFVRYPKGTSDLADRTQRALARCFPNIERVHGSRDYFHVQQGAYTFEFVPVLNITSWREAENVTDMSPLHVTYVQKKLRAQPYLAGEIRLVKQFCKAARIYGAESYIGGFSGHVIDLLTIHYGGFRAFLKAAAAWPQRLVLDPEHHHKDPEQKLNASKLFSPLVLVDPLQPERNSAAALTREAYDALRKRSREYLAAPERAQQKFFKRIALNTKELASTYPRSRIIEVRLAALEGKRDVVGAKCKKVFEHCLQALREEEFTLRGAAWEFDGVRARCFFAIARETRSTHTVRTGPPLTLRAHVIRFRAEHKETFTKDGRIHAREPRAWRDPRALLRATLTSAYAQERIASFQIRNASKEATKTF